MSLNISSTKFYLEFNSHKISVQTERLNNTITISFFVDESCVYTKIYPLFSVANMNDTAIIHKAGSELLDENATNNKYIDIIRNHFQELNLIQKDMTFVTNSFGIVSTLKISIIKSKYKFHYINGKTKDSIQVEITAETYSDVIEKIRFYFKELADCNQFFAEHIDSLSRNEYINYSESTTQFTSLI